MKRSIKNEHQTKSALIALVGNPNSGKSTFFNLLTGSKQRTGNYPGVTVERKEGYWQNQRTHESMTLIDLPGIYSLTPRSPDEQVTIDVIFGRLDNLRSPQAIIAFADLPNLQRSLYLVSQLRELQKPMILLVSMCDKATELGISINFEGLSSSLGIPVFGYSSHDPKSLEFVNNALADLTQSNFIEEVTHQQSFLPDTAQAISARYRYVDQLVGKHVQHKPPKNSFTRTLDNFFLHPILGPIALVSIFSVLFTSIFFIAQYPMDWIDSAISQLGNLATANIPPGFLSSFLSEGMIAGVGSVLVFLPQILILFSFIYFFEGSGYMARAVFILDRILKPFGLNGRSFIPLLSSFACAVPGIMSTRTIENQKERLLTILTAPFMTCSARLPVYTLFIGAFLPQHYRALTMGMLYAFGLLFGLLTSFVFNHTILRTTQQQSFYIDLPNYQWPSLKSLFIQLVDRSKIFLKRAGTVILAVSIVIWALGHFPQSQTKENQLEHSYLGQAGKLIEPVVKPLGYDWKLGVGLIASFAAREVLVSTLGTIYSIEDSEGNSELLQERLKASTHNDTGKPVFTLASVMSLLVFYMLACQCVSTLAITRRETNSLFWPTFMFVYMTLLAYGSAWVTYRFFSFFS